MVLSSKWLPNKEEVIAKNGVVTANHPQSAEAGLKMLRKGGNAVDAAVAACFCNGVVSPSSGGIAGQGIMLIHLAEEDKTVAIDFNGKSPRKATPDMYKIIGVTQDGNNIYEVANNEMRSGAKGVLVPGTAAGLYLAHRLYGRLTVEQVMEPAITLASEGFVVRPYMTYSLAGRVPTLLTNPYLAEMWLPHGRVPTSTGGEKVIQQDLGRLLKRIAREGPDAMYKGEIGDAIAEHLRKGGGVLTKEDLAEYEPKVCEPMATSYRDYTVMTVPAPIGGQTLLQTLNILENFDLQSLGHNTVRYLHLFIECARHAFADRYRYLGDWEVAKVPIQGLLSKEYAKEIAQKVNLEKAAIETELDKEPWVFYLERAVHDPWKYDLQPRPAAGSFSASTDVEGTTHVNAADKDHNFVCCTHFCDGQGPTPPGTGVYLNGMMGQLIPRAGHPNSVEGWKRPLTNDSPIMVLKDGSPIMCAGAPGGRRIINRVNQVFLNVVEFGMSVQDAIAMPTVDASGNVNIVGSRMPREVISGLEATGHRIEVVEESPYVGGFSSPHGIFLDYDTGLLHGGVEVFGATLALGL